MQTTVKRRKPDMPISKDKVKDMISILELSQRYSPKIRENVRHPLIICPFHQNKNLGSCRICTDTNTFKCESCGAHGDMLKLASGYLGIPTSNMNEHAKSSFPSSELYAKTFLLTTLREQNLSSNR